MSDCYIYGYSDTPQKHNLTLMLRCNEIAYEFIDPPDYEGAVCIHIPRPQYKWQRKVVNKLFEAIRNNESIWTSMPIKIYRKDKLT